VATFPFESDIKTLSFKRLSKVIVLAAPVIISCFSETLRLIIFEVSIKSSFIRD
jgi:hypothetical protein